MEHKHLDRSKDFWGRYGDRQPLDWPRMLSVYHIVKMEVFTEVRFVPGGSVKVCQQCKFFISTLFFCVFYLLKLVQIRCKLMVVKV